MRCWHRQGPNWTCLNLSVINISYVWWLLKPYLYAMKNKIIVFLWIFTLLQNDLWKLLMIDAYSVANWTTPLNMNRKNGKNLQDSKDANTNRKIRHNLHRSTKNSSQIQNQYTYFTFVSFFIRRGQEIGWPYIHIREGPPYLFYHLATHHKYWEMLTLFWWPPYEGGSKSACKLPQCLKMPIVYRRGIHPK